jgi:hypothetical protein
VNTPEEAKPSALGVRTMRASASWFLDLTTLLGHGTVKGLEGDFRGFLDQLIPEVEKLAGALPQDDVPARVAVAAVEEARRRMAVPEAEGLQGEVDRVKEIARSLMSLSHHHDALTGITMCLACDRAITDDQSWEPFSHSYPSEGTARSGRVHAGCAKNRG